ncbi:endonuclease 8-like 1 [Discoglossus pictus]
MPEGPDLHLASRFVNTSCAGLLFTGEVEKSEVSKNPEVPFCSPEYTISSVSRGKEVKLILTPVAGECQPIHIVFRFGMSGSFKMRTEDETPKHAHLRFYTKEAPRRVLCFVDPRRFGSWEVNGTWQPGRGPCVMLEYDMFRDNVLNNLSDKIFNKSICEALLDQKYFNGIGNYLRAEILYRSEIPPFVQARPILEALQYKNQESDISRSKKVKIKKENPDLLQLCNMVPLEVLNIGGKDFYPGQFDDYSPYQKWMRCYFNTEMKTLKDHNGRTIWFQGDPGPLAPKGDKAKKKNQYVAKKTKSVKVEKTGDKRKTVGSKDAPVKKEKKEEEKIKRKQGIKIENVEDGIDKKKGKKAELKLEKEKGRRTSCRRSQRLTIDSPKLILDAPTAKTRPRRLKSEAALFVVDSPKQNKRSLRKTDGRRNTVTLKS